MKITNKQIRQMIKEELDDFRMHPVARMMQRFLSAAMTANYQTIIKAFEDNAETLHIERWAQRKHKSHKKELLDSLADAMYAYQQSHGAEGLEQLINLAEDVKFEYETHDERDLGDEDMPF
jgi:hypothetical protein